MHVCVACGLNFNSESWECPACHFAPVRIEEYLSFAPAWADKSDGFDPDYFEQLAALEASNFWFRSRNRLIIWGLQKYFPDLQSFLEIGCGTAFVLSAIERHFPGVSVFGSEIYLSGLTYAAKRLNRASLFQMDALRIPFVNEFDVVGAFDVLEHIESDEYVLLQMNQALRPKGGIIVTVPQHAFLWSQFDEYSHHVRRYSGRDLKAKVERAGFRILKITSFVSLLLPLLMLSRLRRRKPDAAYDVMAELRLNTMTNIILEKVLGIELAAIQLGLDLPFGGSLLLVARKD